MSVLPIHILFTNAWLVTSEAKRGDHNITWKWNYRWLWVVMCVLVTETWSSEKHCLSKCWVISRVPSFLFSVPKFLLSLTSYVMHCLLIISSNSSNFYESGFLFLFSFSVIFSALFNILYYFHKFSPSLASICINDWNNLNIQIIIIIFRHWVVWYDNVYNVIICIRTHQI